MWALSPAGPAIAAPTPPPTAPRAAKLIPLRLPPKHAIRPDVAGNGRAVQYSTCGTVHANLKRYAARHVHQVTCITVTHGATSSATKGAVKAAAHAPSAVRPLDAASTCAQSSNGTWVFERTDECSQGGTVTLTITDVDTGLQTGLATFVVNQDILLQPTRTTYTENDSISETFAEGSADVPGTLFFDVGCGSPCSVLYNHEYSAPLVQGQTLSNIAFAYEDTPGTQQPDLFMDNYVFDYEVPDAIPTGFATWDSVINIRCDNQLGGQPAGCVFPDYTPYLELSLAQYGAGAANVFFAENLIPGGPGLSTPLTRGDPANTQPNRDLICDSTFIPTTFVPDDSCDEYPFASSQQSGGAAGLTGSACMEIVPINVNGTWYYQNFTPITGQPCERGHVPEEENEDVGTPLITMINTNRVLTGDPYWVVVTA